MKLSVVLLSIALIVAGCANAYKINKVQLGMTKQAVIDSVGRPVGTSSQGETEYLHYSFYETNADVDRGRSTRYYVRLVNGKVDSYGRFGDFDSTQKPTVKIETDENINQRLKVNIESQKNLYSELMKLKELREEDILSKEEYEKEKKELLEKY